MIYPVSHLQEVEKQRRQDFTNPVEPFRILARDSKTGSKLPFFSKVMRWLLSSILQSFNQPSDTGVDPSLKDCLTC